MRKPVLLKVPGVKMVRVEALMNFINSEENRPIDDSTTAESKRKRSDTERYVKLLDMQIAPPKGESNPGYDLSLLVLTEHVVRDAQGGDQDSTPRSVINEIFDRLGIFPKHASS